MAGRARGAMPGARVAAYSESVCQSVSLVMTFCTDMSQTEPLEPIQPDTESSDRIARSPRPFPTALRALNHRNFRLFFVGQLISMTGTWMQSVAQSWLVYRLTGSAALLGAVGFASQIP